MTITVAIEGADGAKSFLDSNGTTWNCPGVSAISTEQQYTGGSSYKAFSGSSYSQLTFPGTAANWSIGAADFDIRFRAYRPNVSTNINQKLFDYGGLLWLSPTASTGVVACFSLFNGTKSTPAGALTLDTWTEIRLRREGPVLTATIGASELTFNIGSNAYPDAIPYVGKGFCYVDDLSISLAGSPDPGNTYSATPDRTTVAPGQTITVDFETTDSDGTYYYEIGGTATTDDIVGGSLTGSFTVTSGTGSFDIDIEPDATGGHTLIVEISKTGGGAVVDTAETVTITIPTIVPDVTSVNEGGTVVFTVTGPDGVYGYSVTSGSTATGTDWGMGDTYGEVTVTSGTGEIELTITEDFTTEGEEDFSLDLWDAPWPDNNEILVTSDQVTINDTSNTTGVDFTFSASPTSVNEGAVITLTATSSVMPPSGYLYYAVDGTAIDGDFSGPGEIEMVPDGFGGAIGTVDITVALDEELEGTETCTIKLRGSPDGANVASTDTITISDTSIPDAAYYLLMGSSDVEGGSEPGTLFVGYVATGTTFYWEIGADSYMDAADFVDGITSGTFTNSTGDLEASQGAFAVYIAEDALTEVHQYDIGTATSATATSLTDTSKSWDTDQQAGKLCVIVGGTADGERNIVDSNTGDTLVFADDWEITPDETSEYRLEEWFRVLVYRGSDNTGELVADSGPVLIDDTSLTAPTFSVTADKTTVPEGDSLELTATALNFTGDTLWYVLSGSVDGGDFSGGASGSFSVVETAYPEKTGSATITVSQDESLEGVETFYINIRATADGPTVASFGPITILDEQYSITPDRSPILEGETVIHTLVTANSNPSDTLYWVITGNVDGGDFTVSDLSGTVTLSGGIGTITKTMAADAAADGLKYWYIEIHRDAVDGPLLCVSSPAVIVKLAAVDYDEFTDTLGGVRILLVELDHSDGTEYLGNWPYIAKPTDTLANQGYDDDLLEATNIETRIDAALTVGEVIVANNLGDRDDWLTYNWAGYEIRFYEGRPEWSRDDFRLVARATNGGISTAEIGQIVFTSYDSMAVFNAPLQTSYLDDGRLVPFAIGKPFNVPALLISQPDDEYQVHEGAVTTITPRDNGAEVASTDNLSIGTFELPAQPQGNVAADVVTSFSTPALAITMICDRYGETADASTVGDLPSYDIGLWYDSQVTGLDVLMHICQSIGGFPVRGADGEIEVYVLEEPAITPDAEVSYPDDIKWGGLRLIESIEPAKTVTLNYLRNWSPASRDSLAGILDTDPEFAEQLTQPWSHIVVTNSVDDHPLANAVEVDTYLVNSADAYSECNRVAGLHSVRRGIWQVEAYMSMARARVGDTLMITYPAYGFEAGANARILSVNRTLTEGLVVLTVWL